MTQIEPTVPSMSADPAIAAIRQSRQALEAFFRDDWKPLQALIRSLEHMPASSAGDAITAAELSGIRPPHVPLDDCEATPNPAPTADDPAVAGPAFDGPLDEDRLARLARTIQSRISTPGVAS